MIVGYYIDNLKLSVLQGSYPARLKKVLIVTAPLWFKAPFKILRLFVREKLRDRVINKCRNFILICVIKSIVGTNFYDCLTYSVSIYNI